MAYDTRLKDLQKRSPEGITTIKIVYLFYKNTHSFPGSVSIFLPSNSYIHIEDTCKVGEGVTWFKIN